MPSPLPLDFAEPPQRGHSSTVEDEPGYISTKLHKAISPDARFHLVNIAEWESVEAFQAALDNPELQDIAKDLPSDIPHYPGLYEVIRT